MKIAFLNIYNGKVERGSEVFVGELAARLFPQHEVTVFQTGNTNDAKYNIKKIQGIPYIKSQNFFYHLSVLLFTLKCLPTIFHGDFDWIIPVNGRFQAIICRIIRFIKHSKILITGHAGVGFEDRFNIIAGNPDVFIALSPKAFTWAKNYSRKVKYIPNGVDIDKFNPSIKPAKIDLAAPIIFCNSALLPYKRVDLTIRAVSQLKKASLLLVGVGEQKSDLVSLGIKLLGKRFRYIPYIPHDQIASYYRSSSIFTQVSRESEAFGLVYLEALACNIPIVAPNDINRKEIIGQAGLYCDPENIKEYAHSLNQALDTKWYDKPRSQAEKFSWLKIVKQYEKIMERT